MKRDKIAMIIVAIAVVLSLVSCKRRHLCICKFTGEIDTAIIREYRGYSRSEAQKVCESDNYASTDATQIDCSIL